jgi:L-seryl-tRNA(Ser) seleniumtransferase
VLSARYGKRAVVEAVRSELASAPDAATIMTFADQRLERRSMPGLRRVINATGIVQHTNLGRAPMAQEAIDAVANVAAGYCNLEFDLEQGQEARARRRLSRYSPTCPAPRQRLPSTMARRQSCWRSRP